MELDFIDPWLALHQFMDWKEEKLAGAPAHLLLATPLSGRQVRRLRGVGIAEDVIIALQRTKHRDLRHPEPKRRMERKLLKKKVGI